MEAGNYGAPPSRGMTSQGGKAITACTGVIKKSERCRRLAEPRRRISELRAPSNAASQIRVCVFNNVIAASLSLQHC
jgi:hypothetical protein